MAVRILVPFEGEGAGVGELSWGQQEIWLAMEHQRSSLPITGTLPLPGGSTVAGVAADLSFAVSRHQALRTRLRLRDGGFPQQVVAAAGGVPLEVVEAAGDPAQVAAGICRRYHDVPFGYEDEWPIRWAVVTRAGIPTHLVSAICHIAADGMGVMAMMADLAARRLGPGRGPVTAMQPLEQARHQATAAARQRSDAALRYWEELLSTIPARRFTGRSRAREPRHWQFFCDSPAAVLAVRAVAARTQAGSSVVMLAAFAVALAEVTGGNPVAVRVVVSNRFRPGLADSVSPVNQTGLCVLDVAGITFDQAVSRAWSAAIRSAKHAYYDPLRLHELVARVGRERGEPVDISCLFNDRRMLRTGEEAPAPAAGQVEAALPLFAVTAGYRHDKPGERLFFHVNDAGGTGDYEVCFDTRFVSPQQAEALLRAFEAVAVRAALDPGAPTGIGSRPRAKAT